MSHSLAASRSPHAGCRLSSPAATRARSSNRISITTGGTGGVYYPLGGGMANILSKYVPGMPATAEVTGGSVDNLKLIGAGKSEVAFIDGRRRAGRPRRASTSSRATRSTREDADGALSEQDARRHRRGHRHQQAVRSQGQARVDRVGGQRHRDHGAARARGASASMPRRTSSRSGSAWPRASTR